MSWLKLTATGEQNVRGPKMRVSGGVTLLLVQYNTVIC